VCHLFLTKRSSLFRSYRGILPSSFNRILSTPSCIPRVHLCWFKYGMVCIFSYFLDLTRERIWNPLTKTSRGHIVTKKTPLIGSCHSYLRGRLTLHWFTVCRNPRTFGDHDFHMIFRYSCQHSHFWYFQLKFSLNLRQLTERSATLWFPKNQSRRFGDFLELRYIFGALKHRPVSYYAFIIRWLLPSLLPGCFRFLTSFPTQRVLWNLSVRSGLFPSRLWTFAPKVCL